MKSILGVFLLTLAIILAATPALAGSGFYPGGWGYEQGGRQVFYAYAYELPAAFTKLEAAGFKVEGVIAATARTDRQYPAGNGCFPDSSGQVICVDDFSFVGTYETEIVMIVARKRASQEPEACRPLVLGQ